MIKNLHIKNFRLFDDFNIDGLARINLIVGKNNIGKSSLLEAVHVLVNPKSPSTILEILEMRGEITSYEKFFEEHGYKIQHLFFGHKLIEGKPLHIRTDDSHYRELRITFIRDGQEYQTEESPFFLELEYKGKINNKVCANVIGGLIENKRLRMFDMVYKPCRHSNYVTAKEANYRTMLKYWDDVNLTYKETDVLDMLHVLEPHIERIAFKIMEIAHSGILVRDKKQGKRYSLASKGDGVHRLLTIAIALASAENGYLLVDEIDTGFHHKAMTAMWQRIFDIAERLNVQVFATTHSLDCIRSFAEVLHKQDDKEIGTLFRLEQQDEQTKSVRYDAERLSSAVEQGIEVR
ncbi:MAG: hypothetical protein B6242_14260 [Anaerolineaceae bacterium 4572_78]|nr:MAG: hypothetical protein B6242_14260 [Anaerolineaceae bacterium 4572_78]